MIYIQRVNRDCLIIDYSVWIMSFPFLDMKEEVIGFIDFQIWLLRVK